MSANRTERCGGRVTAEMFWFWIFGLAVIVGIVTWLSPATFRSLDLRAFYVAAVMVLKHPSHLYDLASQKAMQDALVGFCPFAVPFYHPSYEALLYVPLTVVSYRTAYFIYLAWNMAILGACYVLVPPAASDAVKRTTRTILFVVCLPVVLCMVEGQNSILFLLLMIFVWRALDAGEYQRAGMLLALGLFKPQVVLVIAVLLAVRCGWRFVKGFVPVAVLLALISVALVGVKESAKFLELLRMSTLAHDASRYQQFFIGVWPAAMPSLYGFLYVCGARLLHPSTALLVSDVLSVGLLAACVALMRRARMATALSIAICCGVLTAHHLYLYDLTVLLLPVFLLSGRRQGVAVATFYAVPFFLYFVGGLNWFAIAAVAPMVFLYSCVVEIGSERRNAATVGESRLVQTIA